MFAKVSLNKNAILVAYTLMSDVACASTTLKHSCAADFYEMLRDMRADCYRTLFIVITEWSIHMLLFSVLSLSSAICVIEFKLLFYFQTEHSTVIMINERD